MQSRKSTVNLFGVAVQAERLEEAVDRIDAIVRARRPTIHVVLNAAKISKIVSEPGFLEMMRDFDLVHADGASVVLAGRLLGRPLPERVAGIDLMTQLLRLAARRGYRPFLLGARPEVVQACADTMRRENPGLEIAGVHDGYWDSSDEEAEARVVCAVRESAADLLFIAMPTPRKELFLYRHRDQLGVPFAMGVGGAFDVVTGVVQRAPLVWQKAGMEWAYRLFQEPRKMWKRYLFTNAHFAWILGKAIVQERVLRLRRVPVPARLPETNAGATHRTIETEVQIRIGPTAAVDSAVPLEPNAAEPAPEPGVRVAPDRATDRPRA